MTRHYHLHMPATADTPEQCIGCFGTDRASATIVRDLSSRYQNASILSLPDCTFGPNDDYTAKTYCVGRGVLRHP